MSYKKGDMFVHKEYSTFFMIESAVGDMYTCFYPTGHPKRDKPWARYSAQRIADEAVQVTDKKATQAMRILYDRQSSKS
jgi:hypothetical protein